VRSEFLPFSIPSIGEEEVRAVTEVLRSGWLTTGPRVREFESAFADYVGCKHAVAVNSATAAMHLALEALGIGPGDEVLVPSMTFAATGEVVCYFGAKPVLVDCESDTLNVGAVALEAAITPKTKAIIPVHFGGHPCDMTAILALAESRGIPVVEDAAHCLPSSVDGKAIGTIGNVTCFSFYATKTITTGEGGMAATDSKELADRMRVMSLHGISKDAWKRYTHEGSWFYEISCPGFKYNLTDIAAALGLEQLKKCDALHAGRTRIAAQYNDAFADLKDFLTLPSVRANILHSWHLYVIRLNPHRLRISRNEVMEELRRQNIGASVHFIPLHMHPFYRDKLGYRPEQFPISTDAYSQIVSLPIYPRMSPSDVSDVIQSVRDIILRNRL